MSNELWYPIYDTSTNDVKGAGFFAEPDQVSADLPDGQALGQGQAGEIPNDLIADDGSSNYTYNTSTNTVNPKS